MPDASPIAALTHDPAFGKLPEPEKYDAVIGVLEKHEKGFVTRDPAFKHKVATGLLNKYGALHPASAGEGGPDKPLPTGVQAAEDYVLPAAGAAGGALVGGALGGPAGAAAGAGAGFAGADLLSAKINQKFFGRHPDLSLRGIASREIPNAILGAVSEVFPVGRLLKGALGATPLIGGARAAEQEFSGAAERLGESQVARQGEATAAAHKAAQQTAQELAPQARQAVIEQSLGRTAPQGAAARAGTPEVAQPAALPGQDTMMRQTRFHDAVFNPLRRASSELGKRYETLFAGVKKSPVADSAPLSDTIDNLQQFSRDNGFTYGRPVRELMGELPGKPGDIDEGRITEVISGRSTPSVQAKYSKLLNEHRASYGDRITGEQNRALAAEALGAPSGQTPTVEKMLGWRSRASEITRSSASGRDKAAAFQLMDSIDDTLTNSDLVDKSKLAAVNRQYGSYKRTFDNTFRRRIGSSFEPTDDAGEIFTSPQRFSQLWTGADVSEKATLKENYADWLLRNGVERAPSTIKRDDQKLILQKMFPNTPLADPQNWIHLDDKLATANNIINTSPELRNQYGQALKGRLQDIVNDSGKDAIKWAQQEGPKLGPYGAAMAKAARLAKTPQEGAQIVVDFFQQHPDKAPVQALQRGIEDRKPGAFVGRAMRGLAWYPELLIATGLMGHPSTFAAAGLGMAGVAGAHMGIKGALKYALKNPETAQVFWRAVNDADSFTKTRAMARMAGDAMVSEVANQISSLSGARKAEEDRDVQGPEPSPETK